MGGKTGIGREKLLRSAALEESAFLRRENPHARVHREEMAEARGVIAVAVRDENRVELRKIDAEALHVALENRRVVSGIEQDPLSTVLDKCRETPVPLEIGGRPEGVVEDGDPPGLLSFQRGGEKDRDSKRHASHLDDSLI